MSTAVQEILNQILRLPDEQRAEFDNELSRIEEAEWMALAAEARKTARGRGLDDAAIARAVESFRDENAR